MSESHTDRHWKRWAEQDPYHGVLGRGFDGAAMDVPEVRRMFFAQGDAHIDMVLSDAEKLGVSRRDSALDFGCGVGRLVRPLSQHFDKVVGVDISAEMLRLARENCPDEGRVDFTRSLDDPKLAGRRFDLVHSYIVLQHIRPAQGLAIIAKLVEMTAPGGVLAIHFTVGDINPTRRRLNAWRYRLPPLHWMYNLRNGLAWNLPISEMNAYPIADIIALMRGKVIEPMAVRSFDQNGHQGIMMIGVRAPS